MTTPLLLVLGNKNISSWSLRPWVLLRHAGIPFQERVFLFEEPGWRDEIVKLSPSRRVPALRWGEHVIWDSLAICELVAEIYPEAELWPADRAARAFARSVSAEMHSGFAALRRDLSMDVTARHPPRTLSAETEADIARIQDIWQECRERYGSDGPFLFGRFFSVADAMYAPVVWRFRTYGIPVRDRVRGWYDTMLGLPAMRAWEQDAAAEVRAAAAKPKSRAPDPTSAQHCYAVVFTSQRAATPGDDYDESAKRMVELARRQPGFLGIESARGADGFGISVSYWESLEAIAHWKNEERHAAVQRRGKDEFYSRYEVRVCTVERGYKFP